MRTCHIGGDLRGSICAVLDSSGNPTAWFGYDPFGAALESQHGAQHGGDAGLAERLTRRYTGQVFEHESGLYHYGARLCDTTLARFVSVDPAHQTPSPYAYCANDPVDHIDPDGRDLRRVIYYQGWFLLLDETDSVYAIVGQSDEYLLYMGGSVYDKNDNNRVIDNLLDLFPGSESLRNAFALPPEKALVPISAALRSLAESGETMPVSARVRLENIINRAIGAKGRNLRSRYLRKQFEFQGMKIIVGPGRRFGPVGSQSYYRSQSGIDQKKLARVTRREVIGTGLSEKLASHANTIDAKLAGRELFLRLDKSASFFSRHELKLAAIIEGADPEASPFVSPEMKRGLLLPLAAYVMGSHSPLSEGLDNAIRSLLSGLAQLPSNTTAITSPIAHDTDDESTEPLNDSSHESYEPPAKPGGEKPYIPSSDEDTESL